MICRMKRVFLDILYILLILSCEKYIEGGYAFSGIYILQGETLIDAQDYELTLDSKGNEVVLQIASGGEYIGVSEKKSWNMNNELTINGITAIVDDEVSTYEYVPSGKYLKRTLYVQRLTFKASPNTSNKRRKGTFKVLARSKFESCASYIHVTQKK